MKEELAAGLRQFRTMSYTLSFAKSYASRSRVKEKEENPLGIVDWRSGLKQLIGARLRGTILTTGNSRSFYFGDILPEDGKYFTSFVLSPECGWRIHNGSKIVVGSQDYDWDNPCQEKIEAIANGFGDVSKQGRLLRNAFGDAREDKWFRFEKHPTVLSVEHDELGGFVLNLEDGFRFSGFLTATTDEWDILGLDTYCTCSSDPWDPGQGDLHPPQNTEKSEL